MGMDVIGVAPTSERGEYFRNNVWWWRPLWNYCCEVSEEAQSVKYGHSNDGDGLDGDGSIALAKTLIGEINSGRTKAYQDEYTKWQGEQPRRECTICNSTGIRSDKVGVDSGQPERELSPEVQILTGRTHGWCNGCDGIGTQEAWEASYPFSVENVEEFAQFLLDSGGFQIC